VVIEAEAGLMHMFAFRLHPITGLCKLIFLVPVNPIDPLSRWALRARIFGRVSMPTAPSWQPFSRERGLVKASGLIVICLSRKCVGLIVV
jgi:hypothetical protein